MRYDEILGLLPRLRGIGNDSGLRLFGLELLFWAVVVLLTVAMVRTRPIWIEKAEIRLRQVSRHKGFWLATFFLSVFLGRLALLPWIPIPAPQVHDEFSYLLAADTFAHGRLTNPPSPMWVHFESFHINMQPTYQSMYPPAQGLALAVGQVLTGVPWVGVLLSVALMCAAIYWMLLGWLPAPWAWLGGAFACVRFGIFSYWMNSYWGGAIAALGGALVLGALPRFRNGPKIRPALLLAFGLLLLANSRPLEGLLFSIPLVLAAVIISIKRIRDGSATWETTARAVLPALGLLAVGAAWMLYYNWRGTGNPLVMPYQLNFQTYHFVKPFPFMKPNPIPEYHHPSMRMFYVNYELPILLRYKYTYDLGSIAQQSVAQYYGFFIWPFSLLILPCAYAMWRSRMRPALVSIALVAACVIAQVWYPRAHYAAPLTSALILWFLFSVRHFRNTRSQYAIWGSRALVIVFAVWMISPIAEVVRDPFALRPRFMGSRADEFEASTLPYYLRRAWIQSELAGRPGNQLIIVHYPYGNLPGDEEWVYNDADIDHAHVVWARDMGYLRNKELLDYYPDRQAWYVDRGDPATLIRPYQQAMEPLKLAYERPAAHKDSPQVAGAGQRLSPAMVKPVSTGLAEIAAPSTR
jgi:hypothetical protein